MDSQPINISAGAESTLPGSASAAVARTGQVNFSGTGTLVLQLLGSSVVALGMRRAR